MILTLWLLCENLLHELIKSYEIDIEAILHRIDNIDYRLLFHDFNRKTHFEFLISRFSAQSNINYIILILNRI